VRELSFELALDTAFKDAMSDFDASAWRNLRLLGAGTTGGTCGSSCMPCIL
jgi:hypothetical protein